MSSLIVEVVPFVLEPHPNADRLSIAKIKGWQCVVSHDEFAHVKKAIYIPIDAVVPDEPMFSWLENYNRSEGERRARKAYDNFDTLPSEEKKEAIKHYMQEDVTEKLALEGANYVRDKYRRIKTVKLRGVISQGILIPVTDDTMNIGDNVAEKLGITKYESKFTNSTYAVFGAPGSPFMLEDPGNFMRYTEIENIKNFPDILTPGEEVIYTEKLHGSNCRIALIDDNLVVGSHKKTHKETATFLEPMFKNKFGKWLGKVLPIVFCDKIPKSNPFIYWRMVHKIGKDELKQKLINVQNIYTSDAVIVYCEVFGPGVQDLTYGLDSIELRVFDISINGKYLDWDEMCDISSSVLELPVVPTVGRGRFSKSACTKYTVGRSLVDPNQIREGVVAKPVKERWHPNLGRVVLKSISIDYLDRKNATEYN